MENENLDSLNEGVENTDSENGGQPDESILEESGNSKKEEPEYSDRERKLFARAKNNEDAAKLLREQGFERKNGQWAKPEKQSQEKSEKSQSNEPDYAKLAFLETKGIAHPDDQKIVQDEAARLKLPLTDVLQMEHIKSKLSVSKDQREALAGMPKGAGRGGSKTTQDVDYWKDQKNPDGTYKTPDDLELAEKVINARIKREEQANKFSDELYS